MTPEAKAAKREELKPKLIDVIVEQLQVDANIVKEEATFAEDLGTDSLEEVELIMALEDEFNIEIPDEDAEKVKTVKDALDYLVDHVA